MLSAITDMNSSGIASKQHKSRLLLLILSALVGGMLAWGWVNRDEGFITPERGLGYWLGVTGGSMMLLLLTYSLRKRNRFLHKIFKLPRWFQFHMTFGIIGPVCILFHSNFHIGSLNSTVALVSMLIVVASGMIGRFLYTNIHYGQNDEKIKLTKLIRNLNQAKLELLGLCASSEQKQFVERLFGEIIRIAKQLALSNRIFITGKDRRRIEKITAALQKFMGNLTVTSEGRGITNPGLSRAHQLIQRDIVTLLSVLRRLPRLRFFERLFSLWHVLHIPFFVLMLVTAITHVVVVHMY